MFNTRDGCTQQSLDRCADGSISADMVVNVLKSFVRKSGKPQQIRIEMVLNFKVRLLPGSARKWEVEGFYTILLGVGF